MSASASFADPQILEAATTVDHRSPQEHAVAASQLLLLADKSVKSETLQLVYLGLDVDKLK